MQVTKQTANLLYLQGRVITIETPFDVVEFTNQDAPTLDNLLDWWYDKEEQATAKYFVQSSMSCAKI